MTNIMEGKEIKLKNIDCIRLLLQYAVQYGPYIKTCWFNILMIISNIEYYHTIGGLYKNEGELFEKEVRRKSRLRNPEIEIEIELKNTQLVCSNISHIQCDNVFSNTSNFDEEGIVTFVSALCKVSIGELSRHLTPRNYSLHKLIEVADYNIFRIQIEWTKIWRLISEHIIYVVNNFSHDSICVDAIDSLRQIVSKLLKKPDLAIFKFQIEFFNPFEIIFTHTVSKFYCSEQILSCISFITHNAKNIHSGWFVIFSIIKFALKRRYYNIHQEIIRIIENVNDDNFINYFSEDVFRSYIECLSHMYLEENMKDISFQLLTNFLNKIICKFESKDGIYNPNYLELLKIFFISFDDLMKFNLKEYFILIFMIIKKYDDIINECVMLYLYADFFYPQILSAALFYFNNSISQLVKSLVDIDLNEKKSRLYRQNLGNTFDFYQLSIEILFERNPELKRLETVKGYCFEENSHKKYLEIFNNFNLESYEFYLNTIIDKLYIVSNSKCILIEDVLINLVLLSSFSSKCEMIHNIIIEKLENNIYSLSDKFWESIKTFNLHIFTCFTNLDVELTEDEMQNLLKFFHSYLKLFYFMLGKFYNKMLFFSYDKNYLLKLCRILNLIFYKILCFDSYQRNHTYKITEDFKLIDLLNILLNIKLMIIENKREKIEIFDEYIMKSIECYNKIFIKYNMGEEECNEIIKIIIFELNNLIPKYMRYLTSVEIQRLFLYIIDFVEAKNTIIRKSVKNLMENLVEYKLITF